MSKRPVLLIVILVAAFAVLLLTLRQRRLLDVSGPLIRESRPVFVNGVTEIWQLEWHSAPKPRCDILDESWSTSPCQGFAFGEAGQLDLVRYRNSYQYERLPLTPFFTGFPEHEAVVQRWKPQRSDLDPEHHPLNSSETLPIIARVRARPIVKIMSLTDTDHDGNATEFFLQTETKAGQPQGIIIGVSTANPHLHAFGTVLHPDTPLVLRPIQWFELRRRGDMNIPVRVMDRPCPDYSTTTDTDIELELEPTPKGIAVTTREYAECGKEPRRLIRQESR